MLATCRRIACRAAALQTSGCRTSRAIRTAFIAVMPSETNPLPAYEHALMTWLEASAESREFFERGYYGLPPEDIDFLSTRAEEAFREWRRHGALWVGRKP